MDSRTTRLSSVNASSFTSIASRLAPTGFRVAGFFVAEFQAKKSQRLSWLERSDESGGVCGHFGVVGNQRNECVLLTVGELTEALQQFAFVQ
jgi:hypothetical protein